MPRRCSRSHRSNALWPDIQKLRVFLAALDFRVAWARRASMSCATALEPVVCSCVNSDFGRAHSAARLLAFVSSVSLCSLLSLSQSSFHHDRQHDVVEYLRMMLRRCMRSASRLRLAQVQRDFVPRAGLSTASSVNSPPPSDSQRTPVSGGTRAPRR